MAPNRPFFSNLLASFSARSTARSAVSPSASALSTSASAAAANIQTTTPSTAPQQPANPPPQSTSRTIPTKATPPHPSTTQASSTPNAAAAAAAALQTASPFASARLSPGPSNTPRSPAAAPPLGASSAPRARRGSDSSAEGPGGGGFRDVGGAEKWYIGGRTAGGEERFYKLGMARRPRSIDRLSLDRVSL